MSDLHLTLPTPENGLGFLVKNTSGETITVSQGDHKIKFGEGCTMTATRRKWWQFWKKRIYWKIYHS